MKPISGFDPNTQLELVRNPDYDPATDTTDGPRELPGPVRRSRSTRTSTTSSTRSSAASSTARFAATPAEVARAVPADRGPARPPARQLGRPHLVHHMNLTQPPFDDIHVRKAMNLVMDKEGLPARLGRPDQRRRSRPTSCRTPMLRRSDDYDPYATEGAAGDVTAAKDEMKQSKYDTNKDGICDAPAVQGRHASSTATSRRGRHDRRSSSSRSRKIGIKLETRAASARRVHDHPDA